MCVVGIRPGGWAADDQTGEPDNALIGQDDKVSKARTLSIAQPVSVKRFASTRFDGRQHWHISFRCIAHPYSRNVFSVHNLSQHRG
jgi:hypothetical protein